MGDTNEGKTYHDIPGNGMAAVSCVLGLCASIYLLGDLLFHVTGLGFAVTRSIVSALIGLALGIRAKNTFEANGHTTGLPKFGIAVSSFGVAFAAVVGFFHYL
jgi:hypothetical protein